MGSPAERLTPAGWKLPAPGDAPEEGGCAPAGPVPAWVGGRRRVHAAASRLAACCNVWWRSQHPVRVCSWGNLRPARTSLCGAQASRPGGCWHRASHLQLRVQPGASGAPDVRGLFTAGPRGGSAGGPCGWRGTPSTPAPAPTPSRPPPRLPPPRFPQAPTPIPSPASSATSLRHPASTAPPPRPQPGPAPHQYPIRSPSWPSHRPSTPPHLHSYPIPNLALLPTSPTLSPSPPPHPKPYPGRALDTTQTSLLTSSPPGPQPPNLLPLPSPPLSLPFPWAKSDPAQSPTQDCGPAPSPSHPLPGPPRAPSLRPPLGPL